MAELLIRASSQDGALLRRIYGFDGQPPAPARPDRIVVDAHVPLGSRGTGIAATARRAGIPLLIDPQTFYLQGIQHPDDRWARLPYGRAEMWTPEQAADLFALDELIAQTVEHQVTHDATAIIPPYVHIDRPTSPWIAVQAQMWQHTRRLLDREGISLPVTAVLALGWRALDPLQGAASLAPVFAALAQLGPHEVALAASKVDQGVRPQDRLMDLVLIVERLRQEHPVIIWEQGRLGEVGIAAGAIGYECGIGWREGPDLGTAANSHRRPQQPGPRPRPVYIPTLGRSIPKRSLQALREHRDIWMTLVCPEPDCCSAGGQDLLADARVHTIVQRVRRLQQIAQVDRPVWRWQHLAEMADAGLELANRINRRAATSPTISRVDTHALSAIGAVSHTRRLDTRSRRVA